jgi:hypothetical protein
MQRSSEPFKPRTPNTAHDTAHPAKKTKSQETQDSCQRTSSQHKHPRGTNPSPAVPEEPPSCAHIQSSRVYNRCKAQVHSPTVPKKALVTAQHHLAPLCAVLDSMVVLVQSVKAGRDQLIRAPASLRFSRRRAAWQRCNCGSAAGHGVRAPDHIQMPHYHDELYHDLPKYVCTERTEYAKFLLRTPYHSLGCWVRLYVAARSWSGAATPFHWPTCNTIGYQVQLPGHPTLCVSPAHTHISGFP